ncbi:immunoglobulin-like and fibronectin type III domain-containing protein 1 isoform X1 [Anguilla anguilla]|uniref:immunoglobulin-like and fibronectin type III domain-containing protein 1 isoform X1 n=1 Tax=Anguilla anguilla TaxID=7936 RepID=UPI0015AED3D4|nr:immunoglobulin-like and fibronectin type III domain-containing protein 1 isoform X1 [Anguilla anguilla]
MWTKTKVTEYTADGQVMIRKRSKVPGVMITQFVEELPEGKSTPDFTRKPIALTIQEGKLAIFRAIVTGEPEPTVTWERNNGDTSDSTRYQIQYDPASHQHTLQMPDVSTDQADTYKCYAANEFGRAVVTCTLNVIEVGFKKSKALQESRTALRENPMDMKKLLKTRTERPKPEEKQDGEVDPKFWELLLSVDKKDYEKICREYGVTDFRWMLKKLNEIKKEREEEQAVFVKRLSNLKHIEVKGSGVAQFEIDIDLNDPNSKIYLYKDGVMVPFGIDDTDEAGVKHSLKRVGKKYIFTVNDLLPEDAGMYQVDVEGVNVFSTDFKVPKVDFIVKIQEVKAMEREDAVFECVLSHPFPKMLWMGKNAPLEQGDKFDITVSEDKLIHKLVVKDCMPLDGGIYAAVAGLKSCNAWLIVEADKDPNLRGKKKVRKTTQAGGSGADLAKIAQEQQAKLQTEREELMAKRAKEEKEKAEASAKETDKGGKGDSTKMVSEQNGFGVNGPGKAAPAVAAPGKAVPADAAPPGKAVPAEDASGKAVPVEGNSGNVAPVEGNSGNVAPVDTATGKADPVQATPGQADPVKAAPGKSDSAAAAPGKAAPAESVGKVPAKEGPAGGAPTKDVPVKDGQVKDVPVEDGPAADAEGGQRKKRVRSGPLVPDTIIDPGVHFTSGLEDISAILGESAEMVCKLSSENCEGTWYKDGKKLSSTDELTISKDGAYQKLKILKCQESHAGKYRFEADGRKTEAMLVVEDPPRFDADALAEFSKPVVVRAGEKATFKMTFVGRDPMKVQWYLEDEEQLDGGNIKVEITSEQSRLLLSKCQRKISGEVKIKIKNEFGTIEAKTMLTVLDKPTPPQGPLDVIESSANCIEFKWRPPKDSGGSPVINYNLERQQVGRNTWKKIGDIPGDPPIYKDTDVDHGRKYCYRIRAITAEGVSETMETEDVQAGTKAYPGPPAAPKVISAFKDCINLQWVAPTNTGGTTLLGYNLEKRKKGSNIWSQVNPVDEPIKEKKHAVTDIIEGMEYEFRVSAINISGSGEPSVPSDFVFARDPKKPPGKVIDLKVTDSTYTTLCLGWSKPHEDEGVQDEAKGYFVEIRPAESPDWHRCTTNAIIMTSFTIKGLKSMAMYWVRVTATNEGGEGEPQELDNYILAMPPPVRPRFTDAKMNSFVVVKAGNSARVNINFEASPWPEVSWLKDGSPVSKRATVSNAEGTSQLLIPSAERSDTGVYTIIIKNLVGQDTFSVELRVTDEPKPPGPVELDENVPGTVTVSWTPSPDEKRDDRLHYMVSKRDSVKRAWHTVADHLFNNKFTVCNIMPGRQYYFRIYAKNDMGVSEPSESPVWEVTRKKEKFTVNTTESKTCNLESAPKFMIPLKMHAAAQGYECYMSCAVRGDPAPHVTWYRDNVSLNTNTNYYITNTCGVCSMLILRVGPKDTGEYKVIAENPLGRAECSTKLTVRE